MPVAGCSGRCGWYNFSMMTDRIVRTLPVAVFLLLLVLPDASDASRAKATTKVITGYDSTDSGERGSNPMNTSVGTARLAALTAGNVQAVVLAGRETIKAVRQGFRPFASRQRKSSSPPAVSARR